MENQTELNEKESLRIITEMINKTKYNMKADSFLYLLWGYLVVAASISQYLMLYVFHQYEYNYIGWPILMFGGYIVTMFHHKKRDKKAKVKTQIDRFMAALWIGFTVSLAIAIGFSIAYYLMFLIPMIIVFYGMAIFISGSILKFKPLIIGGISSWVISCFAFLVSDNPRNFDIQLLLLVICVIIAYIIPGYIIRYRFNNN